MDKWLGQQYGLHIAREMKWDPERRRASLSDARGVPSPREMETKKRLGTQRLGPYDLALKHPVFIRGSSPPFRVSLFPFFLPSIIDFVSFLAKQHQREIYLRPCQPWWPPSSVVHSLFRTPVSAVRRSRRRPTTSDLSVFPADHIL